MYGCYCYMPPSLSVAGLYFSLFFFACLSYAILPSELWPSSFSAMSSFLSIGNNLVDAQLNNTMMTITDAVRCTRTDWLPVISNIALSVIRREVATSRTILRARDKHELPLLTYIDFHPRPRLKSRRPIWSNLPDEAPTIQQLWRTR